MTTNQEAPPSSTTLVFPQTAHAGAVDEVFRSLARRGSLPTELILDFSNSEFIEVAALVFVIAAVAGRTRTRLQTQIRLPIDKNVRDFLRAWNFPNALWEATGMTFWDLVCPEDHRYFGENHDATKQEYGGRLIRVDSQFERLLSTEYCAITTFRSGNFGPALALQEASRWKRQAISSVLQKALHGPEGYFASRIVFEAMMNAIRHPRAQTIQIASRIEKARARDGQQGHLTIVLWDDGESIVETLRSALRSGSPIRSGPASRPAISYKVILEDEFGVRAAGQPLDAHFLPTVDTPDALILLAATLPGITRDASGAGHIQNPDLSPSDELLNTPGMGLYLLVNAAVSVYGGSVAIRCSNHFMNICRSSPPNEAHYAAKICTYSSRCQVLGNLLVIRLPFRATE